MRANSLKLYGNPISMVTTKMLTSQKVLTSQKMLTSPKSHIKRNYSLPNHSNIKETLSHLMDNKKVIFPCPFIWKIAETHHDYLRFNKTKTYIWITSANQSQFLLTTHQSKAHTLLYQKSAPSGLGWPAVKRYKPINEEMHRQLVDIQVCVQARLRYANQSQFLLTTHPLTIPSLPDCSNVENT